MNLKTIFFGTSDFAVPALKSLINFNYKVLAVITQPEKPMGRTKVVTPSPIKKVALEANIETLEPHNLKDDDGFFEKFKDLNPDICIVAAYGKIIPSQYLDIPKYGFLNIHPSLLPKYRGPSPIQTTIMNGEKETGVTIIKLDTQMDHGPIIAVREFSIFNFQFSNQKELEHKLANLGTELLIDVLPKYINGEIKPKEQDHLRATFTKMLSRDDGKINWNRSSREIYSQIRALNPEPGTWTTWNNKIMNIKRAECLEDESPEKIHLWQIGKVIKIIKKLAVTTASGYLILETVQLEGKKEMDIQNFLNGHIGFIGSVLI